MRPQHLALALVLAAFVSACSADDATLIVQVRTDLDPDGELDRIELMVTPTGAGTTTTATPAADGADWSAGVRVFESVVPIGVVTLRVAALDASGSVIVERPVRVEVGEGVRVATVLLTRDCLGVMCPADAGDPTALACLGGRCVPEECIEERADACGTPECRGAVECPSGECTTAACSDSGACLEVVDTMVCGGDQTCMPGIGCVGECTERVLSVGDPAFLDATDVTIAATDTTLLLASRTADGRIVVGRGTLEGVQAAMDVDVAADVSAVDPTIAAMGDGAVLVALSGRGFEYVELDTSGDRVGSISAFPGAGATYDVAWSGTVGGLVWSDGANVRFASVGSVAGVPEVLPSGSSINPRSPVVDWVVDRFVVAWLDDENVVVTEVDEDGSVRPGPSVVLGVDGAPQSVAIAWDGSALMIVYRAVQALPFIGFFRVDPMTWATLDGRPLFNVDVTATAHALSWSGSDHGLVWSENEELRFARLAVDGNPVDGPRTITDAMAVKTAPDIVAVDGGWWSAYAGDVAPCCAGYLVRLCP